MYFQPHLYSRTRDFYEDFGKSFLLSDVLVVTDVYPAREEPIQGVNGELIVNAAKQFGHKDVHYVPEKKKIPAFLIINSEVRRYCNNDGCRRYLEIRRRIFKITKEAKSKTG